MKTILTAVVLAMAASLAATGAQAQATPKPAKNAAAVSITVKVTNGRTVPVTTLMLTPQGSADAGANLLKAPLAPGKTVSVVVKAAKGQCLFDVAGGYEDESEISGSGLNLCKDRSLALVE